MIRVAVALSAVVALIVARLLPDDGVWLGFRLAAATGCLLLPGVLIAGALGIGWLAGSVAWSLTALAAGLGLVFLLHSSLWLALTVPVGVAVIALPLALRRRLPPVPWPAAGILAAGIGFGIALWWVAGFDGDVFFHLAREQKLDAFDSLSLHSVDEFRDGGLHPGYAFPLWQAFVALVARLAGVDPVAATLHEPTVLAPAAFVLAYEAGHALFRSAWAGVAAALAQVGLGALAAGHGGAYVSLALPATAARHLLIPAVLALFFAYVAGGSLGLLASVGAAATMLALVHPSYAVFICVPLVGYLLARLVLERGDLVRNAAALLLVALPTGVIVLLLRPLVEKTAAHDPSHEELQRAFRLYRGQIDHVSDDRYGLAPVLFARGGAIAVAALAVLPLAGLAARRRWAAFVLGGSLAIFALTLPHFVFPTFADAVSIGQARRLGGFVPLALTAAGGAVVLARVFRVALLPLALGAGIALQLLHPGDFGYFIESGGPSIATWIAVGGGALALLGGIVLRRLFTIERTGLYAALATALLVLPVAVHGFMRWDPALSRTTELTPGLVRAVEKRVPEGQIVFTQPQIGYLLGAYAPVYVTSAPLSHVADTKDNDPRARIRDAFVFYKQNGPVSIVRRYGARWILVDSLRSTRVLDLPRAYSDHRYVLYRLE
jgi:hypothetical protein